MAPDKFNIKIEYKEKDNVTVEFFIRIIEVDLTIELEREEIVFDISSRWLGVIQNKEDHITIGIIAYRINGVKL